MLKARILIVDDSLVIRRLLSDALAGDPQLELAGAAANGRAALLKIAQLKPDVVTLDMEMPEMDGLATLAEIRKYHPHLPVIMFSALTSHGASATLDALAQGASDYVTKPQSAGGLGGAIDNVKAELIPKVKALCRLPPLRGHAPKAAALPPPSSALLRSVRMAQSRVDVITIGVSTGGPNALTEIFRSLPQNLPPIVIVQHMPPLFTRHLAERLTQLSAVQVREGASGDVLHEGGAWLAPGGQHMTVVRQGNDVTIELNSNAPENFCRPAVDVLLRSVADVHGANSLTVMLTGMGCDGLRGCQSLHQLGGRILAQDEASSVVWGMPGAVVQAGLADGVVPLAQMAATIVRHCPSPTNRRAVARANS